MAISITISETMGGAAIADVLAGAGTGNDYGSVVNGAYAPIILKSSNTGAQDFYITHDGIIDPITDLKVFLAEFGSKSSATYNPNPGVGHSAALDYTNVKAMGATSGDSKNNADGLSAGFWIDMQWNVSTTNQFDISTRPTLVKIFGDNSTDGIDEASAFLIPADAMSYDNASVETAPSAPVAGTVGKAADTTLGEQAHVRTRIYIKQAEDLGGIYQTEFVFSYSFTA
jgi:hypothetical protein